jgi:hypothetical protein
VTLVLKRVEKVRKALVYLTHLTVPLMSHGLRRVLSAWSHTAEEIQLLEREGSQYALDTRVFSGVT